MIQDEFSHIPDKRKRYKLRSLRDKKCISCGSPICERSTQYCEYHRQYHRDHEARTRRTIENSAFLQQRSYTVEKKKRIRTAMRVFLKEIDAVLNDNTLP